jgi:hypothetical protein
MRIQDAMLLVDTHQRPKPGTQSVSGKRGKEAAGRSFRECLTSQPPNQAAVSQQSMESQLAAMRAVVNWTPKPEVISSKPRQRHLVSAVAYQLAE